MSFQGTGVRREPFAKVLRREHERCGGGRKVALSQFAQRQGGGGYAASLAEEISASGLMTTAAASRRIYEILRDDTDQEFLAFDTADKILTALGINHLWHTELAESIVAPKPSPRPGPPRRTTCVGCGIHVDDMTDGCNRCYSRHGWRKRHSRRTRTRREPPAIPSGPRRAPVAGKSSPAVVPSPSGHHRTPTERQAA